MSKEFIDRGKVIQIETFDEQSSFWTSTPSDAVSLTDQGAFIAHSVVLRQTAKTTFGFLRVTVDATLKTSDRMAVSLTTPEETVELRKSKDAIGLYINGDLLEEVDYAESQVTLQLVLNDERVGCFAIGQRIHPLASRYKIASFHHQPYIFEITTVFDDESNVMIKEIVYESVSE